MDKSQKSFGIFVSNSLGDIMSKLEKKGGHYTHGDNALENFEVGGATTYLKPEHYLMVLGTKHWNAIMQWSAGGKDLKYEQLFEMVTDIIIYMFLLLFMVKGREE